MKKLIPVLAIILMVGPFANSHLQAEDKITELQKVLKTIMPRAEPDSVAESMLPGLYEVVFGAQVIYVSENGRYMIEGDIFDIKNRINITENKRQGGRVKAVNTIKPETYVIFKPEKTSKHVVTVFTDIDCGYCRKLHKEMADYNKLGIEMRYAAYPRSGIDTPSYYKAVQVWCAKDPQNAMSIAKNGAKLSQLKTLEQDKDKDCVQSIKKHVAIARELGVTGTPTLVMGDGQVVPGYVPADRLIKMLDSKKKS